MRLCAWLPPQPKARIVSTVKVKFSRRERGHSRRSIWSFRTAG